MIALEALLRDYHPADLCEQKTKRDMLSFLETHSDGFERSCEHGHFTASGWLLNSTQDRFMLMHHRKLDIWVQPGGHCDGNKDVMAVALKEAREESGIDSISIVEPRIFDLACYAIPADANVSCHLHYDVCFLLKTTSSNHLKRNGEAYTIRWFERHSALPTKDPFLERMRSKWLAGFRVSPSQLFEKPVF